MWGLLVFGPILLYVRQPLQNLLTIVPYLGARWCPAACGHVVFVGGIILAIAIIPLSSSVMQGCV
jgi:phosphate transport system permease protein